MFGHGLYRILSSYWLAHFYLLKKFAKGLHYLVWIAGCWNSSNILYSQALIQRTIVDFPAFLEHSSAEKIAVCAHTNHDPNKQKVGIIFV
jgi:hypothetical protein